VSWLRPFLLGLFTEHIKTKFMALTLAIVLFATVQETLVGTREIGKVTLVFQLSATLQDRWVLLEPRVVLRNLRIKGLRSVVDSIATERERANEIVITVDEDFLARHRPPSIRIDPDFLRAENVPGARLNSIELPDDPPRLEFTDFKVAQFELAVAPASEPRLRLSPTGPYESPGSDKQLLDVRFSIPNVVLRGPATAFTGDLSARRKLFVALPNLEPLIPPDATEGDLTAVYLTVQGVDWEGSGIEGAHLAHISIVQPEVMSAEAFESRLQVLFDVQPRYEAREFRVPILYRCQSREVDPLAGYTFFDIEGFRSLGTDEVRQGRCERLALRHAQAIAPEDIEEKIVLVIDLSQAKPGPDKIYAPVSINVRDPAFRPLLRGIAFQRAPGDKDPVAIFEKKKE